MFRNGEERNYLKVFALAVDEWWFAWQFCLFLTYNHHFARILYKWESAYHYSALQSVFAERTQQLLKPKHKLVHATFYHCDALTQNPRYLNINTNFRYFPVVQRNYYYCKPHKWCCHWEVTIFNTGSRQCYYFLIMHLRQVILFKYRTWIRVDKFSRAHTLHVNLEQFVCF